MTDRDEVIKGLESTREFICVTKSMFETGFPNIVTGVYDNAINAISEALELLKKQEPLAPETEVLNEIDRLYRCSKCQRFFIYAKQKYCDNCGQAVKWDA